MSIVVSRWPYYVRKAKDPADVTDYQLDWSDWLEEQETIASSEWTASSGEIEVEESSDKTTRVWLSGGTERVNITLSNTIVTDSEPVARTAERSLIIRVESQ